MMKARVSFQDMDGFDTQVDEIVAAIESNLKEVAVDVLDNAKTTAAFIDRTGNLRKSITMRKSKFEHGGFIVFASGKGARKGHHAHLVEFGHAQVPPGDLPNNRVPARPFMRPALEKGIAKAVLLFRGNE